ncbi:hypothetical protein TSMG0167 [Halocynthia phage JM-2012]|uniref:hypothetical protein n=1 Tax=Halocynthia phage JM-2012 TaxID=1173297 RepID=UPI00025C6989|nr:hypothetical protein TSMG0167 [Halocynthia phage JM-2012]AFI55450.1 hypothetical protein TSMG0167 [Halocynthia phage JM-2012]
MEMFNLIKKIILGRYHEDNFSVYAEVSSLRDINPKLHICVKYKKSIYPDIRFSWNINSNQVTTTNREAGYVPLTVINKALDYLYGYFSLNNEILPTVIVSPYDTVMMGMLTMRGTQLTVDNEAGRYFILHGSSIDIDRYSEVYEVLPSRYVAVGLFKLYAVSVDEIDNYVLPIRRYGSDNLRGVKLFPKPELAVLDFVANQDAAGCGDVHSLRLYEVNVRDVKSLVGPFTLTKQQKLYDAHITRAHLSSHEVPCKPLPPLIVIDDGKSDLMIRAYDNTITIKHSNTPISIIGL